jgi:ATP-dependent Clp protease ATP-binding subunit ClpC
MEFTLDRKSNRARRAVAAHQLKQPAIALSGAALAAVSMLGGISLLMTGSPLGWSAMIVASFIFAIWLWYLGDLKEIKTGRYELPALTFLHEALEPETLRGLVRTDNPAPYDIWKALSGSEERYFLANRYGLGDEVFEQLVSRDPAATQAFWQECYRLHQQHQTDGYTNMLLYVALVFTIPGIEDLVRQSGLELADIETSIGWMSDIHEKRQLVKTKKHFGGIGRDWAYGYTPILRNLGHNISEGIQQHGFFSDTRMHEQIVRQMIQTMGNSRSTITLVGDEGVGKTTCVYALAETLLADPAVPKSIRYSQIVEMDASTLIANAKKPGELEDLMLRIINEAHQAKNIILFFDEAQVFFGSNTGNVDLTHILQPLFESGSIRMIFAMNPQYWQRLSSTGIAARLVPVNVPPANEENTLAVLRDQIAVIEYRHKLVYNYQALREAFKLGSRYVTTQSMPGAALSVLQQAATGAPQKLITRDIVQRSVEQTYGIKLQTADVGETDNLLHLEDELKKQVISQDRAISVIANALRRSRSGVGNPDRPIGTFLFLGPTGVGKTELSKALARSYFGDEKALIRVDMNQYVASSDVARLITPMQGTELSFLGEVRQKPFSVILLDEIEKAHPSVINTLLQLLDEGMMRDSDNRSVSFRDAIIIATSNAGADEIRRLIDEGQDISQLESTFTDTLISRGSFAPEFVNRFDEVVLFKPLVQDELVQVIDLIVAGINKTLDQQKISVVLTEEAKKWLVAKGYDSKLGARPMRRMAQRYVENTIARRLLEHSVQAGGTIQLDVADLEQAGA